MLNRVCTVAVLSVLAVGSLRGQAFQAVSDDEVIPVVLDSPIGQRTKQDVKVLSTDGSCRVVEVGEDWIYKFPATEDAWRALRREAAFLKRLRASLPLAVPEYILNENPPFAAYRRIPGVPLTGKVYRGLSPQRKAELVRDLSHFLLTLHTRPQSWAEACGCLSWEPTPEWLEALSAEVHSRIGDRNLLNFFDYVIAQYSLQRNTAGQPVICHGNLLGRHLLIDGITGKLTGVVGFGSALVTTRAAEFDYLLDIDADLVSWVLSEYCRQSRMPGFFEEAKLHRAVRLFGDLIAAYRLNDEALASRIVRQIYHVRDAL